MAEPTGPETAAPPAGTGSNAPRDASNWAAKVDRLRVEARAGMRGTNVAGKRLTGPVQGFGKLWQKTYSVDVGTGISPEDAIAVWKAHFPEFWPEGSRFAGALTGISPGDVALLDIAVGGGVEDVHRRVRAVRRRRVVHLRDAPGAPVRGLDHVLGRALRRGDRGADAGAAPGR